MGRPRKIVSKLRNLVPSENGGALAELAIMVPFLVIMLAGVSEFGRFFQTYTTLSKATRSAARYLSGHNVTDSTEINRATNLVVCGKLVCSGGDELATGISASNVCLESTGTPVTTVTVRIPRTDGDCNPMANAPANPVHYDYQPIFNIGALIGSNTFTLTLPISPGTTMYDIVNN